MYATSKIEVNTIAQPNQVIKGVFHDVNLGHGSTANDR